MSPPLLNNRSALKSAVGFHGAFPPRAGCDYLAPYIPAEYIENIREYDVDALESAIGGE